MKKVASEDIVSTLSRLKYRQRSPTLTVKLNYIYGTISYDFQSNTARPCLNPMASVAGVIAGLPLPLLLAFFATCERTLGVWNHPRTVGEFSPSKHRRRLRQ